MMTCFFLLILSSGSESRVNSGGSAEDNVVSKGISGSSSSFGLESHSTSLPVGCEVRVGMDVSVIRRMVIILLCVEDPIIPCGLKIDHYKI